MGCFPPFQLHFSWNFWRRFHRRQPEFPQPYLPIGAPYPPQMSIQTGAPMGIPFPTQSGYLSPHSPSPNPQGHHYRSRSHSHSSAGHHRSRSHSHSSNGHHHHHHSSSREREPEHRSSSHDRQRKHSHSHSHSHGRSRHHSYSNPAPPIIMHQQSEPIASYVTPSYYAPQVYQPQYAPVQNQYARGSAPNLLGGQPPSPYHPGQFPPGQIPRAPRHSTSHSQSHSKSREVHFSLHSSQQPPNHQQPYSANRTQKPSLTHPQFRYSRCTGRKKAVCVGINYTGSSNALAGCQNDAKSVYHFLIDHQKYPPNQVMFLTDSARDPRARPTRDVLLNAMRWLVRDACPDDSLVFHYSGHGGQTRDLDGDETDGYDEVIFPLDYKTAGVITDDEMHDIMVTPLPPGCRLTALFDSCHSGSVLDLPYDYHSNGRLKGSAVSRRFKKDKSTPADVISWTGCKDSQTSADTTQNGVAVGAMSYAFIKVLKRNPNISYQDLLRGVREILNKKYSQRPQLSSSHKIDTNLRFIM
ncbi:hypothetical protein BV25DRAFT_175640 [Artomyces pyxidatus]|uniref:Uncharacterized protein n=1 Tax=Artomyces pyxidatus TaxID=48021 RepID=A0ACB8SGE7_9AGAM|nr:hypothetical protein BV25DRAFT_175640 [Artomyces pyxidatus]